MGGSSALHETMQKALVLSPDRLKLRARQVCEKMRAEKDIKAAYVKSGKLSINDTVFVPIIIVDARKTREAYEYTVEEQRQDMIAFLKNHVDEDHVMDINWTRQVVNAGTDDIKLLAGTTLEHTMKRSDIMEYYGISEAELSSANVTRFVSLY